MKRIVAPSGVVFYRSEQIPCPHGFSTRLGGVSTLAHTASLNLGLDRGDGSKTVLENLSRFAEAVGFDAETVVVANQIHSNRVVTVDDGYCGEGFYRPARESCDGLITSCGGVTVGVRTADCVPILLYAPPSEAFSGAVSAVHAGWRGTAGGIGRVTVDRMVSDYGCRREDILCGIGPSIGVCCFEVDEPVYAEFCKVPQFDGGCYTDDGNGKFHIDLWEVNRRILMDAGVSAQHIAVTDLCTRCHPDVLWSHRACGNDRGSLAAFISLSSK